MSSDFYCSKCNSSTDSGDWYCKCDIEKLKQENERLREALNDLKENGTRFDLNPTHDLNNPEQFFHGYIKRIDDSIRMFAQKALEETK